MQLEESRYAKTPRAWEALSWPERMGRQAHTVLLLANGKRSEQELVLMLGNEVKDMLHDLQQQGYLQRSRDAANPETDDDTLADA
jgi:hypothetical protein